MKVIYTDQSIDSLHESIRFLIDDQDLSEEKVDEVIALLFDRADSLEVNPYKGQYEECLEHLNEGHRRLIEGYFKIVYKIGSDHISIVDFFDARQDPEKMKS